MACACGRVPPKKHSIDTGWGNGWKYISRPYKNGVILILTCVHCDKAYDWSKDQKKKEIYLEGF